MFFFFVGTISIRLLVLGHSKLVFYRVLLSCIIFCVINWSGKMLAMAYVHYNLLREITYCSSLIWKQQNFVHFRHIFLKIPNVICIRNGFCRFFRAFFVVVWTSSDNFHIHIVNFWCKYLHMCVVTCVL